MKMTIQSVFKTTFVAGSLTYALASSAAAWVNDDNFLDPGTTIQSIAANANKNSYTGNPALTNDAWGMQGSWLSFQVPSPATTVITLTSATTNAPGFTVYRTNGSFTGKGTGVDKFTNGAIHDFNQVAQAGTAGIVWATDASVTTSLPGNTTANGIVETLGYVNASGIDYTNAYGASVKSGAYDLSVDNLYENGVYGSVGSGVGTTGGLKYATLTLKNLAAGYYTIFLGGTNTNGTNTPIDVMVSAITESLTDCFFNWKEKNDATLFSPAGAASQTLSTYYYRYYKNTNSYLGVSSVDNHVYYVGPDGKMQDQGSLSALSTGAGCK